MRSLRRSRRRRALDSLADDDFVDVPGHLQQRSVEGPAAQVVDQDVLTFGGDRGAVPVGVFQSRGGRLVQQRDDLETCRGEGVQCHKALCARRIGGHADRGLDGLAPGGAGIRALNQVVLQLSQEPGEQVGQPVLTPGQYDRGLRAGVVEQTLERSEHVPARFVANGGGVQSEAQLAAGVSRYQRRPRVDTVVGDDGVVATVDDRSDGVGGAEVDTDSHSAQS